MSRSRDRENICASAIASKIHLRLIRSVSREEAVIRLLDFRPTTTWLPRRVPMMPCHMATAYVGIFGCVENAHENVQYNRGHFELQNELQKLKDCCCLLLDARLMLLPEVAAEAVTDVFVSPLGCAGIMR